MKKLKYGIISASSIVPRFINAVNQTNHSEVIAIASRSQKQINSFNIPKIYSSYQDLYEDPDVDIVYIANINDQHVTEIKNALNHNKHVLCEKPFVLYPEEVIELFELAKSKKLFLMEAQKSPFLPVTQHLKRIIDTNELGKLFKITINNSYGNRHPDNHWMHQAHQGGVWIPSANYLLEYLHFLIGNSPIDYNYLLTTYGSNKTIDEAIVNLRYPNNLLAQVSLSTRVITDDLTKFYFENGWVEIYQNWKARSLTIYIPHQKPIHYEYPVEFELVYEIDHVFEMISNQRIISTIMTPNVTYDCVSLVHEIYLSTQK